jgi:hypothetical protein
MTTKASCKASSYLALVFALLVPISATAMESLKLRGNRQRCELATSAIDGNTTKVAKLDFAFLFGRRCITFGSARSSEFLLPVGPDVASSHFIIHLNPETATLSLTDISAQGTWIRHGEEDSFTRLHCDTVTLRENATIMLGDHLVFDYVPTAAMITMRNDFLAAVSIYKSSILKRLDSGIDGRRTVSALAKRRQVIFEGEARKRGRLSGHRYAEARRQQVGSC